MKKKIVFKKNVLIQISLASLLPVYIYLNRFLLPDQSTDTLNYHLFSGARALNNYFWPFSGNEFFPLGISHFSPVYDAIGYSAARLVGYRLGTVVSLLSSIAVIYLVYKIIQNILPEYFSKLTPTRVLLFVNCIIVSEIFFQIATYFVDILNLAVLLMGVFVLLKYIDNKKTKYLYLLSIIFGFALFAKLTNLAVVVPIIPLIAYLVITDKKIDSLLKKLLTLFICSVLLITPLAVFLAVTFYYTSNPIFPFYNAVFKSPYYSLVDFKDTRYGAKSLLGKILYPIVAIFKPNLLAEPNEFFADYKLQVTWLIVLVLSTWGIIKNRIQNNLKVSLLVYIFFSSILLWSIQFGIGRYAIFSVVIGGVLVIYFLQTTRMSKYIVYLLLLVMTVINIRIIYYNSLFDMSWRKPLITSAPVHKAQVKKLLYRNVNIENLDLQSELERSEVFLNCYYSTSTLYSLISPNFNNKPVVNIIDIHVYGSMTSQPSYRKEQSQRANIQPGQQVRFASLAFNKGLDPNSTQCIDTIKRRGGIIENQFILNSFMGDTSIQPEVITGTIILN